MADETQETCVEYCAQICAQSVGALLKDSGPNVVRPHGATTPRKSVAESRVHTARANTIIAPFQTTTTTSAISSKRDEI